MTKRPVMWSGTMAARVGKRTENLARAVLHEAGWITLRSWMSRSPADLVAMKAGSVPLLIQVKKGGYMTPLERLGLWNMAQAAGAVPVLCRMESDGTLTFHTMTGHGVSDLQLKEV